MWRIKISLVEYVDDDGYYTFCASSLYYICPPPRWVSLVMVYLSSLFGLDRGSVGLFVLRRDMGGPAHPCLMASLISTKTCIFVVRYAISIGKTPCCVQYVYTFSPWLLFPCFFSLPFFLFLKSGFIFFVAFCICFCWGRDERWVWWVNRSRCISCLFLNLFVVSRCLIWLPRPHKGISRWMWVQIGARLEDKRTP